MNLTAEDRGKRCVVLTGWATGARGVIVGPASVGSFFTVQLDGGPRFCALPGQVGPITDERRTEASS